MKKILVFTFILSFLVFNFSFAETITNTTTSTAIPSTVTQKENLNDVNVKSLINQLKVSLNSQKKKRKTYLGFVSSINGKSLVKNINKTGEGVIIATTKTSFCAMKKLSDNSYLCIDSDNFMGTSELCSKVNVSCTSKTSLTSTNYAGYTKEQLIAIISQLLKKNTDNTNIESSSSNINNNEELLVAIKANDLSKVQELLKASATINTPLLIAFESGNNIEIIKELIKGGANINEKYPAANGSTILMLESGIGEINIVKELIKSGADINAIDLNGKTALGYAALISDGDEIINELKKSGAIATSADLAVVSGSKNAMIKATMDQLKTVSMMHYLKKNTFQGLAQDSDFSKLLEALNQVTDNGLLPSKSLPQISDSAFCLKVSLTGNYGVWCVDSDGYSDLIKDYNYCGSANPKCK